ncbi:unnamed protein product [Oikopleura dioica]|uniref:EamA domain-containing protein n=1 Tax=Oikopleura dioica TaxID=34765 RepID=E4XJV3_OIKDI|nr:unnamed protein product [Oikopleura dioica]
MKEIKSEESSPKPFGLLLAFLSAIFFSFNGVIIKQLSVSPIQAVFWRCTSQFIMLLPVCSYRMSKGQKDGDLFGQLRKKNSVPSRFLWLCFRGTIGSISMATIFTSFKMLPIGDCFALINTGVVWSTLIAWLWLGDKPHFVDLLSLPVSILGIVIFSKPSFIFAVQTDVNINGVIVAVAGAIGASIAHTTVRKLGKSVHFTVSITYFSFFGVVLSALYIHFIEGHQLPCSSDIPWLLFIGPNGLLGLSCLTLALQREKPGRVTIIRSLEIPIAYCFQIFLFDETPDTMTIVGVILIMAGGFMITIRKLLKK